MFPKLFSSSCEISKCNAFVQNKDGGIKGLESLSSSSPDVKVPEMWDELLVNCGERRIGVPNLTVIASRPSQTHSVHHTAPSMDSVAEPDDSSRPREGGVDNTGVLSVVLSLNISDNTTSDKPDIPRTNDTDTDESFKVCDYYSRWGIERVRLRGGGESGVAAAAGGAQTWGQAGGGPQSGWTASQQGHRQQNNNTQAGQPAGPSSQQSQAQGGNNQPGSGQQGGNQPGGNANQPGGNSNQPGGGNNQQNNNPSGGNNQPNNNQPGPNNQPGGNSNQQQNNPNQQPGNNANQPGGNQPNNHNNNNWNSKPGQPPQATSTKQQLEQLNSMREALFAPDGWGGQNVNQDSNWDIPGSPEPGAKESMSGAPPPIWKPNVNNGTDLWEANLRNGGVVAPPAAPVPKAPMSHTPTSHIGGMWGEEDEGDFSNMWTGVPSGGQAPGGGGGGPPQWPGGPGGPQPPAAVWPGKKEAEWGGPAAATGGWAEQRHDIRPDVMRCDQRGISGRLNGEAMWPHHHHKVPGGGPGGGGGWGAAAPPHKDMPGLGKPSGWEEPSPPAQRRTMPNYDDGTSLWGQQNRPAMPGQGKVSHWKDLPSGGQPMGRGGMQCPPVAGGRNPNMKPDQGGPMWHPGGGAPGGGGPRNGWESGVEPCWGEDKPAAAPWLDQSIPPTWQGAANKHKPAWEPDIEPNPASSWGMHPAKQPVSKTNKDFPWSSRNYQRILADMGYKKDDIDNALRSSSMGVEESLDGNPVWGGRRGVHDGLDGGGPSDGGHGGLFSGGPAQVCIPFQSGPTGPPPGPLQQAPASRQQQTSHQPPSAQQLRMIVQQIQSAVAAGYLQQQILNQPLAPQTLILLNQLLTLIKVLQHMQQMTQVQQNSMKATPNHLPQVLQAQVKINQTKQQIANLQNQIASQQAIFMSQHQQKQQQQNAVAAGQQQQMPTQPPQQNDLFRVPNNMHDPLSALRSNFGEMAIKDPPTINSLSYVTGGTGQSRLNQWKLPLLEKEPDVGGPVGEFSRAPGSKGGGGGGGGSPLLPDGGWSTRDAATWPPSDSSSDPASSDPSKDWPTNTSQPPPTFDLVPEFKPGEPWKGNPMKTTDDDPTLTPSSIVRSPLVLPSIVKDSHILGGGPTQGKSSPTGSDLISNITPSISLSTSTWTFNPPTQPQTSTSSMLNKLGGSGAGGNKASGAGAGWGETSEALWSGGGAGKGRPPPGLGGTKPGATPTSTNGWSSAPHWSQSTAGGQPTAWNASTWLLLRNLTPQIDGSTLKTLCIQHGPLINFHLFLNNGIALARYSSREEAQKAQGALNNCVLGNTTIFAENPSDSDVMPLVTHLQNQGGGGGGNSAGNGAGGPTSGGANPGGTVWRTPTPGTSAASQLWSSSTSSLWGADTPTTTNSSFLPADLGGESM